jgi:hypothetical protein
MGRIFPGRCLHSVLLCDRVFHEHLVDGRIPAHADAGVFVVAFASLAVTAAHWITSRNPHAMSSVRLRGDRGAQQYMHRAGGAGLDVPQADHRRSPLPSARPTSCPESFPSVTIEQRRHRLLLRLENVGRELRDSASPNFARRNARVMYQVTPRYQRSKISPIVHAHASSKSRSSVKPS